MKSEKELLTRVRELQEKNEALTQSYNRIFRKDTKTEEDVDECRRLMREKSGNDREIDGLLYAIH